MAPCIFIGDELSAAGFRLAGAQVLTPAPGDLENSFRQARDRAGLLIITAGLARDLPAYLLRQTRLRGQPLLLVVSDAQGRNPAPDLFDTVSRQMGMVE